LTPIIPIKWVRRLQNMFSYNRRISWFWIEITEMFPNSCLQLSLGLSDVRSFTIIAWDFIYNIIIRKCFDSVLMYSNKPSEVIESSVSDYITWLIDCGCYRLRYIVDIRKNQNFSCLRIIRFSVIVIKGMLRGFFLNKEFF